MHDSPHRLALFTLLLAGCSTLVLAVSATASLQTLVLSEPLFVSLALHRHLLSAMLGVGLLVAVFVPGVRVAAAAAATLDKAGFLFLSLAAGGRLEPLQWVDTAVLVALVVALAVLARRARQEARWDGMRPLRSEA